MFMYLVMFLLFWIFLPNETRADVTRDVPIQSIQRQNANPGFEIELSRRLKNLKDLRAKDALRVNQLVIRIAELEDQRMTDHLVMISRVSKLEKHHAKDIVKITEKMENLVALQAKDVRELSNRLAETENMLKTDQLRLTQCVLELKTMNERVNLFKTPDVNVQQSNLTIESRATSNTPDENEATLSSLEEKTADMTFLKIPRSSPNISVDQAGRSVVFSVTLQDVMSDPGVGQTVIFNSHITNVGAKYSFETGIFTCTKPGIYIFSWSVEVANPNFLSTDLMRNGVTIAETTAKGSDDWGVGSTLVAIELTVGDEVWVRVDGHSPGADIQRWGTSFTGFLLYPS
ncbi:uncharacterized protein LOC110460999 [Mizuhopecten yessoensis]|uniref:Complement C1q-like protein 4 n=1 Tax=Mizuhopecten yessoensis TaxID=6573 RepID=A0A210Q179_MIZYE|nr:uncharacterized protein LOC110460999 [Mizuhopecten yessoensis]OWF42482.1 Complement C1q-like protein 4 [Mizuhopecten yessoensis]